METNANWQNHVHVGRAFSASCIRFGLFLGALGELQAKGKGAPFFCTDTRCKPKTTRKQKHKKENTMNKPRKNTGLATGNECFGAGLLNNARFSCPEEMLYSPGFVPEANTVPVLGLLPGAEFARLRATHNAMAGRDSQTVHSHPNPENAVTLEVHHQ